MRWSALTAERLFELPGNMRDGGSAAKVVARPVTFPMPAVLDEKVPPPRKKRPSASSARKKRNPEPASAVDEWEQDDYGLDDYEQYEDYEQYTPGQSRRTRSAARSGEGKKRRKVQKRDSKSLNAANIVKGLLIVFVSVVVILGVTVFAHIFGHANPVLAHRVGPWFQIVGVVISSVAAIALWVLAFQEDFATGLCFLFLPFYQFYWMVTRWGLAKPWLLVWLGGVLSGIAGAMIESGARRGFVG